MTNFLKSLFGFAARTSAAADASATRAEAALNGIADDLEAVRATLRERLGLSLAAPLLPVANYQGDPLPGPGDFPGVEEPAPVPSKNGRGKRVSI